MTQPMSESVRQTIEKTLYYARATVEDYWHAWAGDADEPDSLEKIDTALAWITQQAAQPPSVQPLPTRAIGILVELVQGSENEPYYYDEIEQVAAWLDALPATAQESSEVDDG